MLTFYGTRLSDNMAKTPEGYLICYDVNIARIGVQDYLGSEVGSDETIVKVNRPPEEVFKPATVASFEGKPFTNDHPFELLDVNNTSVYSKGHLQNIRVSDDKVYLIGDIVVTDSQTITDIENGKREVSAGYNCDCLQDSEGNWYQANIIGNHVALVDKGRAGEKVRINDQKKEKKPMDKENVLGKLFKAFAKDAEPDELAEALKAVHQKDEDTVGKRLEQLDAQIASLTQKLDAMTAQEDEEPEEEKTALDACEKELQDAENEESEKKEMEDEVANNDPKLIEAQEEKAQEDEDTTEEIKKEIADAKKVIARIQDKEVRLAVADSFATIIRGKIKSSDNYKKLMDASKQKQVQDGKQAVDYNEVFKKIKEEKFRK